VRYEGLEPKTVRFFGEVRRVVRMVTTRNEDLFPETRNPGETCVINERCLLRTQDGHRLVIVSAMTLAHYAVGDTMAEAHAMVSLVEPGWAYQCEVARAFGCSVRTVRRHQRRFAEEGLSALGRPRGYPPGRARLPRKRSDLVHRLKASGLSNCEIARRIGVSEVAVRKLLHRLGWKEVSAAEPELALDVAVNSNPKLSAFATDSASVYCSTRDVARAEEAIPTTLDRDPANRSGDRLLACLGLLEDATPLFASGQAVPHAGVLLALPALVQGGVFDCAQNIYGSLGPAFYGLRTSLLTLLLMALWRIKRPEGLKEHSPQSLGRVLGLDRAPEVKTLRRKLAQLAAAGQAVQFGRALAQHRVAQQGQSLGFLYIDGHVRVYHGQHRLPKIHVTRLRLSMPATSDYWVNDTVGDPLFVVTAHANASLVRILPTFLEELRPLVGLRRITIVFDRGGYSPLLFQKIIGAGFDLITYRKGPYRPVPTKRFGLYRTRQETGFITYRLADQEVRLLKGALRLRQVTRQMENGHQTPILTSRRDLSAAQVAYRMFERWRQENFFKYLREEYALDALADHSVVPDVPDRLVPNPARAAATAKVCQAQAHLNRLQAQYGLEALSNPEGLRSTVRGFKIAKSKLGQKISSALQWLKRLEAQRDKHPGRVPVQTLHSSPIVKLAPERKHLTNLLKMVAFQVESQLVRWVAPHYRRVHDEGRTLIQSALASAADLTVTDHQLRVTLAPLSSPHRTRAIASLCHQLNQSKTPFPGSHLRLHFAVGRPPL
jgi:transposase